LHPDRVLLYHVLRSAAVPMLTTIGVSVRFALSSLPVVELFFGWNGAGFLLLKAIAMGDYNFTIALLLCFGALIIVINLLLELLYRLADPRLRNVDEQASQQNRQSLWELLGEVRLVLLEGAANVRAWARRILPHKQATDSADVTGYRKPATSLPTDADASIQYTSTWTLWRRGMMRNPAFILGGLLMLGLLCLYLFGPQLAPHSPYTTQGIEYVNGKLVVPPFEPGAMYPWGTDVMGRDIMSLVLAGAQQTLSLAGLVVLARLGIGFVLGAIAGWHSGRWPDRLIQAATEVLAAFPILLLAMLLILALGIRGGFRPFLIGLSLVGWVEIMQFVRGEILRLRPQPFLESAVATGVRTPQIVWRHMTPHLLPALISLAALEMGAVLMLLGELGFIGIFIGGGGFAELSVGAARYQYSDVPEWAALLSNVRLYARVYPWAAIYPALAFFVAILAFNLFGEGLRRLIERLGVAFNRFWNRYTFALILALIPLVGWVRANTGAVAFYRQQAMQFDGVAALQQVQLLSDEANMGRALGSDGVLRAAEQIATEFDALGLQRAGGDFTWFQPHEREFEQLTARPTMRLGHDEALVYGDDFREFAGPFRVLGQAQGAVHFLAAGHLTTARSYTSQLPRALRDLDLSQSIVLVLSPNDVLRFSRLDYRGMLVVTDDATLLQKRFTLPARDPVRVSFGGVARGQEAPIFWISEKTANRILADSGQTVEALRRAAEQLGLDEMQTFDTGQTVAMQIDGEVRAGVEAVHVIGHLPAVEAQNLGGQMIVVMAQYDAPPPAPSDAIYPAANDNASGVAVMLEAIRIMHETGYRPYKTFLFVAYSGEGSEGGNAASPPDVDKFLSGKLGFAKNFEIEAVVDLRGLGAGGGKELEIEASSSLRLADLVEDAAKRTGLQATRRGGAVDFSSLFESVQRSSNRIAAPQVSVRWAGWEESSRTANDTLAQIDADKLEQAGRAITLALMVLGREVNY
ncbi:MAG: ABC transporter permease subunit, partial [Caldilineaceae bacterium]|nr:ABC transporter permease subunit [Caldilineaceae bacterium]